MNTKQALLFFSLLFWGTNCFAQDEQSDSLLAVLQQTKEDTVRVNLLNTISKSYFNTSPENALK